MPSCSIVGIASVFGGRLFVILLKFILTDALSSN